MIFKHYTCKMLIAIIIFSLLQLQFSGKLISKGNEMLQELLHTSLCIYNEKGVIPIEVTRHYVLKFFLPLVCNWVEVTRSTIFRSSSVLDIQNQRVMLCLA